MTVTAKTSAPSSFRSVLAVRNFLLLWIGETVSVLGDQFYLVALPWLALQLTGSGLALGSVLMTAAIPRAAFMLAGGVATDRMSARSVMIASNVMRCAIVTVLTVLVAAHMIRMWHLYVAAAAFGMFDAFFYPAYISIMPAVLEPVHLRAGNSLMQSSVQLTGLIGPGSAGIVVGSAGIAAAFGLDAISFIVSIGMLAMIATAASGPVLDGFSVLASIREGIEYAVSHPVIRSLLVMYAVMNLCLTGPFMVGAPLLAQERFNGATAFGFLLSSFGAGALAGTIAAGRDRRQRRLGPMLVAVYSAAGITMITLGVITRLWLSCAVLLLLGVLAGYNNVQMLAYLQRETEPAKMGRVMSLIMFCSQGLLPISYLASGIITRIGVTILFLASGIAVMLASALLFRIPQFWRDE
jgi:MFS family permease